MRVFLKPLFHVCMLGWSHAFLPDTDNVVNDSLLFSNMVHTFRSWDSLFVIMNLVQCTGILLSILNLCS